MAEKKSSDYVDLRRQTDTVGKLELLNRTLSWNQYPYYRVGGLMASLSLMSASVIFWRAGFRGFYLVRYGRGRVVTLGFSLIMSNHGAFFHHLIVNRKLESYYAPENPWYYAKLAALTHQGGLFVALSSSFILTYIYALRNALLPVMETQYPEDVRFKRARYIASRYKPYYRSIATAWVLSTLLMSYVGYRALGQRQEMLAEALNRRTISLAEDEHTHPRDDRKM